MAGKSYTWQDRNRIQWTDQDILDATEELGKDDRHKAVATLHHDYMSAAALKHFAGLAEAVSGHVKSEYGLIVMVLKDAKEVRDAAVYALKYHDKHAELRDQRAAEQGVEPSED